MECEGPFGEWLKRRRKALDLTRVDLARCASCSVSALRKIEAGERRPSKQLAALLADCLGVVPDQQLAFVRLARGAISGERPAAVPVLVPSHKPAAPHNNLPIYPTPLVGRESELAALGQLLSDPQCRLLTVVGLGGMGKTRLAIEAANRARESYAHGVCFVALAPLGTPEFLVAAIADALGLRALSSTNPAAQLLKYLHPKTLLLLLDSAEGLLSGLGFVSEVLQGAPGIKVLVTSSQPLALQGEWVFALQGLPVPPAGQQNGMADYGAVALFLQGSQRVRAGVGPPDEEYAAIGRICRLVDGMPLGIEMAAAWTGVLSCQEVAQEIERNLDFLAFNRRDIPKRHRSLRAVLDHSWQLLPEEEHGVLRRLSLFRGGFDRRAAEQVAGATLPLLVALANNAMLQRNEAGRYDLHDLVRQYARDKLEEVAEELQAVGDRHSAYYAEFVRRLEPDLKGERQLEALAEISAEIDNVRLAWRWAVTRGQAAVIAGPIPGLWVFYEIRGWFAEAEGAFRSAVEELDRVMGSGATAGTSTAVLREHMRANEGWFCLKLGKLEEARGLLPSSLAALRAYGARRELADALYFTGTLHWLSGDYGTARAHFEEELSLATELGDPWGMALAHGNLGLVIQAMGDYAEAERQWQTTLAAVRALGDPRMVALALQFLGRLKCALAAYDEATAYLREALVLSGSIDDRWIHGLALGQLGEVVQGLGNNEEAARWFRDSLSLVREIGEGWSTLQALNGLGATTLALGQYDEAHSVYCEALNLAMEMRCLPQALGALLGLAALLAQRGDLEAALAQAILVSEHPAASQDTRGRSDRLRAKWEAQLAPGQIEAARARAERGSLEMLVKEVLGC